MYRTLAVAVNLPSFYGASRRLSIGKKTSPLRDLRMLLKDSFNFLISHDPGRSRSRPTGHRMEER